MEGRRGSDSNLSGPRLPRNRSSEAEFDPAKRICFNCGERSGVLEFSLSYLGKPAGRWRLCGPCYEWAHPRDPREADPLTAA